MIRNVLDHGFVRLVSYMQPVDSAIERGFRQDNWSGDLEIVRNARVSYDADWRTGDDEGSDVKLINSMTQRHHTSPFEAMVFTFEVKAPIFVFRQWHRHRTWSYNELSARYAEVTPEYYIPAKDQLGVQHKTDKQMRDMSKELGTVDQDLALNAMATVYRTATAAYKEAIALGVPRELARCVLPVSTYSRMFATVDLHNLKHFLTLRQDKHAQYEIRVYADAIHSLVTEICPASMAAFDRARSLALPTPNLNAPQAKVIPRCPPGTHKLVRRLEDGERYCDVCGIAEYQLEKQR